MFVVKKLNTLYIHGLDSSPSPEKLQIMEDRGLETYTLHLNYREEDDIYVALKRYAVSKQIEFVIGSSMGGFLAYWLAEELGIPCLLFNPALNIKILKNKFPLIESLYCPARFVVLGAKDDVINPEENINYLRNKNRENLVQKIITCEWLGHQVDHQTFDEMLGWSLENINRLVLAK